MKIPILSFALLFSLFACQPPQGGGEPGKINVPISNDEVLNVLEDAAVEFQELSKPKKVRAWVDKLVVKAQPGEGMPQVAILREGEIATYLYQRTMRKAKYRLRGQDYKEPWYLIRTRDSLIGWVHGGGILFVESELGELVNQLVQQPGANQRTRSFADDGQAYDPRLSPEQLREKERTDFLVVPGVRVGPIHLNTSEEALISLYGPAVSRGKVQINPQKEEAASFLYKGTADELAVTWKSETRQQIKAVYLNGSGKWHTANGLKVGMNLLDLTKVNKNPVSFYGFNWEYGGVVESFGKGVLEGQKKFFYLVLQPQLPASAQERLKGFEGDKLFSSQTEGVDRLNLKIGRMVVYLD
jgi:hypothetical protein